MKKITTAISAYAAGFVPRPVAPIQDPIQGSGVRAGAGFGWRLRVTGHAISAEHDSAPGHLTV